MGCRRAGSVGCWPGTRSRGRRCSSRAAGGRRPRRGLPRRDGGTGAGAGAAQAAHRGGPGCRCGHDRVAPAAPPRHRAVTGHDPPDPDPGRRGDTGPGQAAARVVPAVRRRAAERVLAVRLHPLPSEPPRRRSWGGCGGHQLARRPLPLRAVGHRPCPHHRDDRDHQLPRNRCPVRDPGLDADRQRDGLHDPGCRAGRAAATAWRPSCAG
jgi:hypothetical protein